MKKLLMLLALINTSVCFASSDEILPVDKPVESVVSAPVAPAAGRLITGREFLESGGVVASAAGASDLPSHLKCLAVEMRADGFPVNLAWETPEGEKGSSELGAYSNTKDVDLTQSVFGAGRSGCMFFLNGGSNREIEELSVRYRSDLPLSVRPWRSVAIITDGEQKCELLVDKIILDDSDMLCVTNVNGNNVHINHIEMNSNKDANLWLFGKINHNGKTLLGGTYTVNLKGEIGLATVRAIPSDDFAEV